MVGLCEQTHVEGNNLNGAKAYSYYGVTGYKQGSPSAVDSAYGATYTYGDVVGVAFDSDNNTLEFFKNGISQGVAPLHSQTHTIQHSQEVVVIQLHIM